MVLLAFQLFFVAAALSGAGRLVLHACRWPAGAPGTWAVAFAAGSVATSASATTLAALGIFNNVAVWTLAAVVILAGTLGLFWDRRQIISDLRALPRSLRARDAIPFGIIALCAVPGFLLAAAPSVARDALVYHLPIAKNLLDTGGLGNVPGNIFSNFPMGVEVIFALLFETLGERACAGFHWLSFLFTILLLVSLCRDGFGNKASALAVAAFAAAPTSIVVAGFAYIDMTLCLVIASALATLWTFREKADFRLLVLAGAFAGFTVSIKYSGLAYAAILTLVMIITVEKTRPKCILAALGRFAPAGIAFGLPFLVRNLANTGNPVFPFFYSLFGGEGWDAVRAQTHAVFYANYGMGRGPLDFLLLPFNIALRGKFGSVFFEGILGAYFLLFCAATVFGGIFRKKSLPPGSGIACLAAALAFAGGAHAARFALPLMVFMTPLAAAGFSAALSSLRRRAVAPLFAAAGLLLLGNFFQVSGELSRINPFGLAVGLESEDQYRARLIPGWPIYRYMGENLDRNDRVFAVVTGNLGALFEVPFYSDSVFEDHTLRGMIASSESPVQLLNHLGERGFTHLFFDAAALKKSLGREQWELFRKLLDAHARLLARDGGFLLYALDGAPP